MKPGNKYKIALKNFTHPSNKRISRSEPKFIDILITNEDVYGLQFYSFRGTNKFDLSGQVLCEKQYLNTLEIFLYQKEDLNNVIKSQKLGPSNYFMFPDIQSAMYTLVVKTTLPPLQYIYGEVKSDINLGENRTNSFITLHFNCEIKKIDTDIAPSSFYSLVLVILTTVFIFNYKSITNFVKKGRRKVDNSNDDWSKPVRYKGKN